ncbi:ABC-type bicarbonate transport system substrate-binding protein [Stanieria cyanosphaera PCC 7437]|uniref:ABC-type bicarbonate transport system substrate-binding protein n=1 Tax=Stanieria cyanosphaera (strain ATCC 29371 / PCC 7437) TaxID=111780 RepID=K9XW37_STAC7|nr:CmpA/NrtA family ABC transporter substrate-binding protein [Stanieria cyanosphaera]AFZ36748.1 ABC-type bicarbonate transport system substrate-binding protein [Stanieria cyanosphaera PCC 7437]
MSNFSRLSRRKFLATAAASGVSAVFLNGCFGNPPSVRELTPKVQALDLSPEQIPETPKIKLGYLPILEAAPLVIAKQKGFFDRYGMTEVEVSKQANWASARDNVVIGSQAGGIDGGQWQMPMPYLISEGLLTNGRKIPMYVLATLNTQGNGIAVSNIHKGKGLGLDISQAADYIKSFPKDQGRKFKAAFTFPKVNQDFWVRYWLAAGGVDPDRDVDLIAVPPAETVQGMRTGSMDAFSTGDPWPYRIVAEDIGYMAALTSQMWKFHPEEYLAIRGDWVEKNPKATKALLKALMEAQQWCDQPENRPELIKILGRRSYFNIRTELIESPYKGYYKMGDGKPDIKDFNMGPLYWQDDRGNVSYPYQSHDLWFLTESVRWGFLPEDTLANAKEMIGKVNREDLWLEAAKEAKFSNLPTSPSRGVEKFFDGIEFDPENPAAYLNSLTIKKV